jgi:hypothetical protein
LVSIPCGYLALRIQPDRVPSELASGALCGAGLTLVGFLLGTIVYLPLLLLTARFMRG